MLVYPDRTCQKSRTTRVGWYDDVRLDVSLDGSTKEDIRPSNGLRTSPYTFELKGKPNAAIILDRTLLTVKLQIVDGRGQPVARKAAGEGGGGAALAVVGCPISSLWQRIETRINDKLVNVGSARNVAHKGLIEDWLVHRLDHRAMRRGLHSKQAAGVDPMCEEYEDDSFYDGNVVQFCGRPPIDLLGVNNLLSPRCEVAFTFYPNPADFVILNAEEEGYQVKIKDLVMHIDRAEVAAESLPRLPQMGQDTEEVYCGRYGSVRDYQLPKGTLRWKQHVMSEEDGPLPKYVLAGLVPACAFGGAAKNRRDPLHFGHFKLNHLQLQVGGKFYPSSPYSPLRAPNGSHGGMREYYALFEELGIVRPFISPKHHAQGATLYPFNLTPDMRSIFSTALLPPRYGPLSAELGFSEPLPETVVLLLYLVYDQTIEVLGAHALPAEAQF